MISHDQFAKALKRQKIVMSNLQINALLNDLLPNPQSGFSTGGVTVWGDRHSIDKVQLWHHAAEDTLPYFRKAWLASREAVRPVLSYLDTSHEEQARTIREALHISRGE